MFHFKICNHVKIKCFLTKETGTTLEQFFWIGKRRSLCMVSKQLFLNRWLIFEKK